MDAMLLALFYIGAFGIPLAGMLFIVYCAIKGEIPRGELVAAGVILLLMFIISDLSSHYGEILHHFFHISEDVAERGSATVLLVLSLLIFNSVEKSARKHNSEIFKLEQKIQALELELERERRLNSKDE